MAQFCAGQLWSVLQTWSNNQRDKSDTLWQPKWLSYNNLNKQTLLSTVRRRRQLAYAEYFCSHHLIGSVMKGLNWKASSCVLSFQGSVHFQCCTQVEVRSAGGLYVQSSPSWVWNNCVLPFFLVPSDVWRKKKRERVIRVINYMMGFIPFYKIWNWEVHV
jgi:hypothetical protein